MPALAFVAPLAGATVLNIWKPPVGVTPGAAGDAYAPFALGTLGFITPAAANARVLAQFVRCAGVIAIGGTATIANGVATAGAGTWNNDTGVATVLGDYLFVTAGVTPALAADDESVDVFETFEEQRAREEREARETPEERKARSDREAKETPEERKKREMAELRALRKAKQMPAAKVKAGETDDERKLREAEEAEYQKAERERNKKHT